MPKTYAHLSCVAFRHGEFTKQLDLFFESAAIFGQNRSKRYAIVTEDGKVKTVHEEPDNTSVKESAADKVLI